MITGKHALFIGPLSICVLGGTTWTIYSTIGSSRFIFTGINCFLMLLGGYIGLLPAAVLTILFFISKACLYSFPLTAGIPTLLSTTSFALYQKPSSFAAKIFFISYPMVCIFLFNMHPVGSSASLYSLYWIIPVACYIALTYGCNKVLCSALGSTFIAHATGSIMWLYLQPTTPEYWLSLIPQVAFERFIFASVAVITYVILKKLYSALIKLSVHSCTKQTD